MTVAFLNGGRTSFFAQSTATRSISETAANTPTSFPGLCHTGWSWEESSNEIICIETPVLGRGGEIWANPYAASSPDVDWEIARDEIARAHRLAPHIIPATPAPDSVRHIVGIRSSRKGGFRLDSEQQGSRTVLSAYGFGGGGYAFSYGIADALVKMVEQSERHNVIV